jgi:acyl dehydratase
MLDPSYVGRTYAATSYLVGREKIREFALAIGAREPAYLDPDAAAERGHPDVMAPPTFAIVLASGGFEAMITDPGLGLDFSHVVHGDQRFAYARPVYAGDRITTTTTIEDITTRGKLAFLTSRTDMVDEKGEPVVTAWNKLVVRGDEEPA